MAGIKQKIVSLNLSNKFPSINIADGTQSAILGNEVVQATPSLTLIDVLYVSNSLLVLSISQITKHNNWEIIFFPSHHIFQDLLTGKRIGTGYKRRVMYYLNDKVLPTGLVAG